MGYNYDYYYYHSSIPYQPKVGRERRPSFFPREGLRFKSESRGHEMFAGGRHSDPRLSERMAIWWKWVQFGTG